MFHDGLGCKVFDDFVQLNRDDLVRCILRLYPQQLGQRRLCRIACHHFLQGVIFRDAPVYVQRLYVRARAIHPKGNGALSMVSRCPVQGRDHFTKEEMTLILEAPADIVPYFDGQ